MKKFMQILTVLALVTSPLITYSATTDPVVQGRVAMSEANKVKKAEVNAAKKEYKDEKAKAKKELAAEKAENKIKAKAAASEGKDPLVVNRDLNAKSTADYKQKLKVAKEKLDVAEKNAKAKASEKKADVTQQMKKSVN
jgi:hypothetical protein